MLIFLPILAMILFLVVGPLVSRITEEPKWCILIWCVAVLCLFSMVFFKPNGSSSNTEDSYSYEEYEEEEEHECYVCGEEADIKYGSHYYCSTHYGMVKTVVDNS